MRYWFWAFCGAIVLAMLVDAVWYRPTRTFTEQRYAAGGHVVTTLVDGQLRQEDVCQT